MPHKQTAREIRSYVMLCMNPLCVGARATHGGGVTGRAPPPPPPPSLVVSLFYLNMSLY